MGSMIALAFEIPSAHLALYFHRKAKEEALDPCCRWCLAPLPPDAKFCPACMQAA